MRALEANELIPAIRTHRNRYTRDAKVSELLRHAELAIKAALSNDKPSERSRFLRLAEDYVSVAWAMIEGTDRLAAELKRIEKS